MKNFKNIIFDERDNYYLIKVNRPNNLNALNQDTIAELKQSIDFIKTNYKGFFGVVITGEGDKSFVAGADIKEFTGLDKKASLKFVSINNFVSCVIFFSIVLKITDIFLVFYYY